MQVISRFLGTSLKSRQKGLSVNKVLFSLPIAGLLLSTAQAAPVTNNYGNFAGPNLTYTAVTEVDNQFPAPTPPTLFGAPSLSGDSLLFDPVNFDVSVISPPNSSELQDGRLDIAKITANTGITTFAIAEGGAYAVDDGSSSTFASETLIINSLFITSVNGSSINPIVVTPNFSFAHTGAAVTSTSTSSNSASISFDGNGSLTNGSWSLTASFDLSAALAANGLQGTVTGLQLALDNQLGAQAEDGGSALIDKKSFLVGPGTPSTPEPATLGLVGLGMMLATRRRRD
jgi:hypothetical protein